jgi:molybdenum-dependent DNA-binding transcriptional regulator ModE
MLTPEERALITDIGDKLLDRYARRDDAIEDGDLDRAQELQAEITETAGQRQQILHSVEDL